MAVLPTKKAVFWTVALVVTLVALNAYLVYDRVTHHKDAAKQVVKQDDFQAARAQLDTAFNEAMAELRRFREQNKNLDAIIKAQEEELTKRKQRIETLLQDATKHELTSFNLEQAKAEIIAMRTVNDRYLTEIKSLQVDKEVLVTSKADMGREVEALSRNLSEVSAEKQDIAKQKDKLEKDVTQLEAVVRKVCALKANNIKVTGIKTKANGQEREILNANKSDKLKVCFDIELNETTNAGLETFYVRILDPSGNTMAFDNLGAGTLTDLSSQTQVRYTFSKDFTYDKSTKNICVYWHSGMSYQVGYYQVELYNKGYLAGKGRFVLH